MNDPSACGHPLDISGFQMTFITQVILMQHMTLEHIGHGLKPPVWVRRKPSDIFIWLITAKFVEHQKGVHPRMWGLPETAIERHARPI